MSRAPLPRTPAQPPSAMRRSTLLLLSLTLASATDLTAQRRGRRARPTPPEAVQPKPQAEPAAKPDQDAKHHLAIVGGDVLLGTGQRLTGATVLIADDHIEAVGHNVDVPEGATVLDAKGRIVCPGFVIVEASGMGAGNSAPFADTANPFSPDIKQGLAAGITTFLAGSTSSRGSVGGSNAAVKLSYGSLEGMVLAENTVAGISVPLDASAREKLEKAIEAAKKYLQELDAYPAAKAKDEKAKPPQKPRGAEKLVDVLQGKTRLWISFGGGSRSPFARMMGGGASRSSDVTAIREALEIARLLGRGVVLVKPISAWLVADEIAATGSSVILSPRTIVEPDPKDPDHTGTNFAAPAILAKAGVAVAVTCPSGMFGGAGVGTSGLLGQDLNTPFVDAAYAVRGGLDNRKALRTLTLDAAEVLGVSDRVGSIEAGKHADILILDGDPLHYGTFVTVAVVNGKVVYEKGKEALYRHIQR